jgi:tRNA dimethylallyltransferase
VGKTAFAIRLARHFSSRQVLTGTDNPAPILSADARQCYRELNIGVAKPSADELAAVPHYFINSHSIHEDVNAAVYARYALETLRELFLTHDRVVVVGGTGLYLKALMYGLDEIPGIPKELRQDLETLYHAKGLEALQETIRREDPKFAETGDLQNPHRLIRALEVVRATGKSIRDFQQSAAAARDFDIVPIALDLPRAELYDCINRRVELMMAEGLLEEVRGLQPYRHLNALQTVGYQELFDYLDGKMSLEQAVDKIKQHTRNYAKRQLTWFRADPAWRWYHPDAWAQVLEEQFRT